MESTFWHGTLAFRPQPSAPSGILAVSFYLFLVSLSGCSLLSTIPILPLLNILANTFGLQHFLGFYLASLAPEPLSTSFYRIFTLSLGFTCSWRSLSVFVPRQQAHTKLSSGQNFFLISCNQNRRVYLRVPCISRQTGHAG